MKLYRIQMNYKLLGMLYPFIEFVKVKDDECIGEVIECLKERLYYDWDNAPMITGVNYHLIDMNVST